MRDKIARLRFPTPTSCGRTPLTAKNLSKSYGSLKVFADVDLAINQKTHIVVLNLNGTSKTTLLHLLSKLKPPNTNKIIPGHNLRLNYYTQKHETLDHDRTILKNMRTSTSSMSRANLSDTDLRKILNAFLFSKNDVDKPTNILSNNKKTQLALTILITNTTNVLLLNKPTNNLNPINHEQVLNALHTYTNTIILVTHNKKTINALSPNKIILLPNSVENT